MHTHVNSKQQWQGLIQEFLAGGGGGTRMRAICICYDVASHDILGEKSCLHQELSETEL